MVRVGAGCDRFQTSPQAPTPRQRDGWVSPPPAASPEQRRSRSAHEANGAWDMHGRFRPTCEDATPFGRSSLELAGGGGSPRSSAQGGSERRERRERRREEPLRREERPLRASEAWGPGGAWMREDLGASAEAHASAELDIHAAAELDVAELSDVDAAAELSDLAPSTAGAGDPGKACLLYTSDAADDTPC
eukprot:296715-Pyramimonas_sp.AAC.1